MDWREHENLVMAAGLARRAARPRREPIDRGVAAAELLQREGGMAGDVDPLEARMVEQILHERQQRQASAQRREEERRKWEQALNMQTMQNAREDRIRGEERTARREDTEGDRTFTREREKAARQHEGETYKTRHTTERSERTEDWHRQQLGAMESQVAALQASGEDIPPALQGQISYHREALGMQNQDRRPVSGEGDDVGRLPSTVRRQYEAELQATGDFEGARAARAAKTYDELMMIPAVKSLRDQRADPIIEEAARMLDENRGGFVSKLFGHQEQPWQEPSGIFEAATYSKSVDDALSRAKALVAQFPRFRQLGITPEEIVARYRATGRFANQTGID